MSSYDAAEQAANISSYLRSKGWERDSERHGATIWHLGDSAWVLVPDLRQYDDADFLIHEAISSIAKYEDRSQHAVWQDISEPLFDSQFFRLHPDTPSGSIPLSSGLKVTQSVFEIMKAAAAVTEKGAPLLVVGPRTKQVNEFMQTVLLGSAAPGSYILTTRFSTQALGQQELMADETAPVYSGRAVAERLHSSISAARQAAQEALQGPDGISAFYTATQDGVSANLCKALSALGGDKQDKHFEIGFSWAHGAPGRQVPQVEFTSEMPRILAAADRELTRLARRGRATITGMITDLHAERNEQSRAKVSGDLQAPDNAGLLPHRALWVQLNDADYDRAIEAHRDENTVRAIGWLTTKNRRLELQATTFEVFRD